MANINLKNVRDIYFVPGPNQNSPSATILYNGLNVCGFSHQFDKTQPLTTFGDGLDLAPTTQSAALELKTTEGAFLISRMTTAQRDLLVPSVGMLIYNTITSKFEFCEAVSSDGKVGTWNHLGSGSGGGISGPSTSTIGAIPTWGDAIGGSITDNPNVIVDNGHDQTNLTLSRSFGRSLGGPLFNLSHSCIVTTIDPNTTLYKDGEMKGELSLPINKPYLSLNPDQINILISRGGNSSISYYNAWHTLASNDYVSFIPSTQLDFPPFDSNKKLTLTLSLPWAKKGVAGSVLTSTGDQGFEWSSAPPGSGSVTYVGATSTGSGLTASGGGFTGSGTINYSLSNPLQKFSDLGFGSTNGQVLSTDGNSNLTWVSSGNMNGPSSATNGAIPLFDGTTGKLLKDSTTAFISTYSYSTFGTTFPSLVLKKSSSAQVTVTGSPNTQNPTTFVLPSNDVTASVGGAQILAGTSVLSGPFTQWTTLNSDNDSHITVTNNLNGDNPQITLSTPWTSGGTNGQVLSTNGSGVLSWKNNGTGISGPGTSSSGTIPTWGDNGGGSLDNNPEFSVYRRSSPSKCVGFKLSTSLDIVGGTQTYSGLIFTPPMPIEGAGGSGSIGEDFSGVFMIPLNKGGGAPVQMYALMDNGTANTYAYNSNLNGQSGILDVTGVVTGTAANVNLTLPWVATGIAGQILASDGPGKLKWVTDQSGSGGTVTSVGLNSTSTGLTVTGSPVITSGTIGVSLSSLLEKFSSLGFGSVSGKFLSTDGAGALSWASGDGSGTVTSVGLTGGTGLTVSDSPVTTSGTINLSLSDPLQKFSSLGFGSTSGRVLSTDGNSALTWVTASNLNGPSSATDGAIPLFDGTTGKLLKDSTTAFISTYTYPTVGSTFPSLVLKQSSAAQATITADPTMLSPSTFVLPSNNVTATIASGGAQILAGVSVLSVPVTQWTTLNSGNNNHIVVTNNITKTSNSTITLSAPWASGGTNGQVLSTNGSGVLSWVDRSSTAGTVTSVGLTGGTGITVTGTSPIVNSGSFALSLGTELQSLSSLSGSGLIQRNSAGSYSALTTGTAGKFLQVAPDGTTLQWAPGDGAGTVTSVGLTGGTGITVSGSASPISSSGTFGLTLAAPLQKFGQLSVDTGGAKFLTSSTSASATSGMAWTSLSGTANVLSISTDTASGVNTLSLPWVNSTSTSSTTQISTNVILAAAKTLSVDSIGSTTPSSTTAAITFTSAINVTGNYTTTYSNYGFLNQGGASSTKSGSGNSIVSIFTPNRMVANEFDALSSLEIKKIDDDQSAAINEASEIFNSLNFKKYTFKDTFKNSSYPQYGVIAEEVREVRPDYVTSADNFVPNIMQLSNVQIRKTEYSDKEFVLYIENTADLDLYIDQKIQLFDKSNKSIECLISGYDNSHIFVTCDEDLPSEVFVYGTYKDCPSVSKQKIFELGMMLLQDALKRIDVLERKLNEKA